MCKTLSSTTLAISCSASQIDEMGCSSSGVAHLQLHLDRQIPKNMNHAGRCNIELINSSYDHKALKLVKTCSIMRVEDTPIIRWRFFRKPPAYVSIHLLSDHTWTNMIWSSKVVQFFFAEWVHVVATASSTYRHTPDEPFKQSLSTSCSSNWPCGAPNFSNPHTALLKFATKTTINSSTANKNDSRYQAPKLSSLSKLSTITSSRQ